MDPPIIVRAKVPRPPKNIRKEGRMAQNLKPRLDRLPWYTSGFL